MTYYFMDEDQFFSVEPTLAQGSSSERISLYKNIGVDLNNYTDWDVLDYELWVTGREDELDDERYQARVKYADSNLLAIRAFLYNIFEYLTIRGY